MTIQRNGDYPYLRLDFTKVGAENYYGTLPWHFDDWTYEWYTRTLLNAPTE